MKPPRKPGRNDDIEIIRRVATRLNREVEDVLGYQKIVVDRKSGLTILKRLSSPGKPTKALRDLMRGVE